MVAKISLGNSLYGAIAYNGEKINKEHGRVLDTNKIFNDGSGQVDIKRAFADFMRWMPSTTKTEKTMVHISLNPHPEDVLTDAQYTAIAREYMEKMGFGDMPYIVVTHEDIDRHHMHIVALRVDTDGRCISDRNNFYRSKDICREIEREYRLHTAERQKITPDMPIVPLNPSGDLKRQTANIVKMVGIRYKFQTLGEYNAVLSLYNIRCEQTDGKVNGREYHGLVYFALGENGNVIAAPFKASRLGKFASRIAIDNKFERSKLEISDKKVAQHTRQRITPILASATDKEDFIVRLKAANIDVVFRYTDEGRIYGATFIDHSSMCVLNGSRMGKEFSANALNERFNSTAQPTETPVPENELPTIAQNWDCLSDERREQPEAERDESHHAEYHPQAPRNNSSKKSDDLTLPGLDLFQPGMAFNPDEEEFIHRMKRKGKRGRRPKF